MSYELFTDVQSPNYYNEAQCLQHYGISRSLGGITIHHWGNPNTGLTWDGVRRYLSRQGGNTSAHYVVEAGRVAYIVPRRFAAWHAGSAIGNARTTGIEMRPEGSDEDYKTTAELISDLWKQDGKSPLYRHDHWSATSCPGDIDVARLEAMATEIYSGGFTPVDNPIPVPAPAPAPTPEKKYNMDRLDLRNAQNVPVRGRHVDNLQGLLLATGLYGPTGLIGSNGHPDGIAGRVTKSAVDDWQRRTNTGDGKGNADSIVGDRTWKSLIEY